MKKISKRFCSMLLAVMAICSMCPGGAALEAQGTGGVTFTDVSQIAIGGYVQRTVFGADGEETVIRLERVAQYGRAGGETWLVQYKKLGATVQFYMTVSNNKVTSVYDYYISIFGASYDDPDLTKTPTYGKLTFTLKSIGGISASTCWLKGEVTGEDDEINVTWQM